ncbi:phage recombination protein Bet [Escherichia coli]|uniref:phage recombination protein Bet n=1 Tax=Escherichia coli TaxID=562 RepID=UPI00044842E2|nr:phage recombination protein Bet [Escherichia coli]EHH6949717.1 phage recombination protein Bet [Escherichia coli]EZK17392.1 phage recombination protein Bet [Escherichia coli 2-005-03_S1_C3]EZK35492.1 phage recombination protein Bet [Escherichia coli 2-005-03_S1_C2]EZK52556.1 phage recombination protein Bet [Escherichia coli 2-005-03_S1_C1]KDA64868.1 phage recombination protein Bet [Escherichia coli 2-052-05_S1_C1]
MSTALATLAGKLAERVGMDSVDPQELITTLRQTAFKGDASDAQFIALLIVANQYGLNPWTKEIYAFPDKQNGIVPVVGVDGWSRIINENQQFDGMDFEQDNESCTCRIYRKDRNSPVIPDGLSTVCAEAYQVVGVMADALGVFGDAAVQKVLDNLSQQKLVHRDVLPFSLPVTPDGWISCSERMPKETGDIIVVSDGIVMSGISYSRRDGFYIAALEYDDDEPIGGVTHWMPLPEPPRLKEL